VGGVVSAATASVHQPAVSKRLRTTGATDTVAVTCVPVESASFVSILFIRYALHPLTHEAVPRHLTRRLRRSML
jgi:hypothetical protein